jgi:hypothetical protein
MRDTVERFFQALTVSGKSTDVYRHEEEGIAFTISYDQSQRFAGSGYLDYRDSISKTNNPIYRRLRRKAEHLASAPSPALKMVILCDGGCATMSRPLNAGSYRSVSASEIAADFLRQNSSIDLLLLVKMMTSLPFFERVKSERKVEYELIPGRLLSRFPKPALGALYGLLNKSIGSPSANA